MKRTTKFLLLLGLALCSTSAFSQDDIDHDHDIVITVPPIALVDVEGASSITLEPATITEAGEALDFTSISNDTLWLNYSSIIETGVDNTRDIYVKYTGTLPGGTSIDLTAAAHSGSGGGDLPVGASSTLTLTNSDQTLFSGIGSAYTGDGYNNGHQLTYELNSTPANYGDLDAASSTTITVTFTISDN